MITVKKNDTHYMNAVNESARCYLCKDAPCNSNCPSKVDIARFIRGIRFERKDLPIDISACKNCTLNPPPCEEQCIHNDFPIRIKELVSISEKRIKTDLNDVDLSIDFCGIKCENPFFLSSSVVASNYEMCANALNAGWGGIVFKTIGVFKPKEVSPRFDTISKENAPFVGFRNLEQISDHTLSENLDFLKRLKEDFPAKIIVASIMGQNEEEWEYLAKEVTKVGVDIIELNFSCPHMSGENLGSDVGQNIELVKLYTECVKKSTDIPVLAKMTPNIGNMETSANAAVDGGADGIAAINTIKSITNVSGKDFSATPSINGKSAVSGYSGKAVKPIALRFINDLHKFFNGQVPLSGMGGIETWNDALEFILLGCENVQVTTAVMQYGYRIIDDLIGGLKYYMLKNNINSIKEIVGKASQNIISADNLDRDTVIFPQFISEKCVGCGRCYISCMDAGHQAIEFNEDRKAKLKSGKCVGCLLCSYVCPVNAIIKTKRVKKPNYML